MPSTFEEFETMNYYCLACGSWDYEVYTTKKEVRREGYTKCASPKRLLKGEAMEYSLFAKDVLKYKPRNP